MKHPLDPQDVITMARRGKDARDACIRQKGVGPEFTNLTEREIFPWLRKREGFLDLITLVVPNGREVATISFWDEKASAQSYKVFAERPADSTLLLPSIEVHQQRLGRIPGMVAADAGFYSSKNEKAGQALGVRWMSVPSKKTKSSERKLLQHQRWFRKGQKWRTGSEGRISVLKRRHGLRRSFYPGLEGMRR